MGLRIETNKRPYDLFLFFYFRFFAFSISCWRGRWVGEKRLDRAVTPDR